MAFIVFEGLDKSGKSTLIQAVSKELSQRNIQCLLTHEPGGTFLGEIVRDLVLQSNKGNPSAETEILLISAARRDHIEKVITPALTAKKWILCDRFWASTEAFQGKGRGLPDDQVKWLKKFTVADVKPDLWFLLDMPVTEKNRRSQQTKDSSDRFESEEEAFHQRVRTAYLELAHNNNHWCILNALLPVPQLSCLVIQELIKRQWLNS